MSSLRARMHDRMAERARSNGEFERAIQMLMQANRRSPSPERERLLLRLRNEAFHRLPQCASVAWPPSHSDRFAHVDGVPEISADQLSADAVRAGVFGRGALIVRGLVPHHDVEMLAADVDQAFAAYDRSRHGKRVDPADPWFAPFEISGEHAPAEHPRRWIRAGGGVYAAESPRAMFHLTDVLERAGITRLVETYFAERAALSVLKTTLRIVEPDASVGAGWHQDGAFLGAGVRSLNLWVALTACGRHAPGLQMVPHRIDQLVNAGTGGAAFSWSVDTERLREITGGVEPAWLEFEAGDAVFFDELNLHSTATRPGMSQRRKAIEAWFFAASHYPFDRVPLLV